jgi:uncharacterized membrane protein
MSTSSAPPVHHTAVRHLARVVLAVFLVAGGVAHLVVPDAYLAQVPTFLPARAAIVLVSGIIEIALGLGLVLLPAHRARIGRLVALFFVAIFPGNLYQAIAGVEGFGLASDRARWLRLAFQPLLVVWALWSTSSRRGATTARRPT